MELGDLDPRHRGAGRELHAGDLEAGLGLLEVAARLGLDPLRREAGAAEPGGERHREAPGVGRGDQLLGIGSLPLLEAGAERIGALVSPAAQGHRAVSLLETARPDGFGIAYRHRAPPLACKPPKLRNLAPLA